MSGHTPGPWLYRGQGEIRDCNGIPVAEAYLRSDDSYADDANGRLIAAAPELLDALQSALEWGAPFKDAPRGSRPKWFGMAKQAIAKATGDQA